MSSCSILSRISSHSRAQDGTRPNQRAALEVGNECDLFHFYCELSVIFSISVLSFFLFEEYKKPKVQLAFEYEALQQSTWLSVSGVLYLVIPYKHIRYP